MTPMSAQPPYLVGVIMGSTSDWDTMRHAADILDRFGVPYEKRVVSAHRTPQWMAEYATTAESRGLEVIIAGAGGAAHLPGMVAAHTLLPVLGVPVQSQALNGLDSLLSIVQMPGGMPVGDLAIGKAGATNAGMLAVAMLAVRRPELRERLRAFREEQAAACARRDAMSAPVLPGAAIGVLGSGQLGRMFAIAARRMGYRVHVLSPDESTPPPARWPTSRSPRRTTTSTPCACSPRRPRRHVRIRERPGGHGRAAADSHRSGRPAQCCTPRRTAPARRRSSRHAGLPVTPFPSSTRRGLQRRAVRALGCPAVLKTAALRLRRQGAGADRPPDGGSRTPGRRWAASRACSKRSSTSSARSRWSPRAAQTAPSSHYGVVENQHARHILDVTIAPAASAPRRDARPPTSRAPCSTRSESSACCASSSS